jgi:hypothetical protein
MPSAWAPERLVEEVERLSIRGLPRHDYFRELTLRLQRTIPFGGACWHSLDPRTLLMTSVDPTDLYERLLPPEIRAVGRQAMLASEYQRDDVNTFAELARRRIPVGTLLEATAGCPERSARYRELFAPVEASDELRAAFVARKRGWGSVVLARRGSRPFTTTETRLIARLSGPVAEGLRAAIRSDAVRAPESANAPGLVVLGPRNEIEMITPSRGSCSTRCAATVPARRILRHHPSCSRSPRAPATTHATTRTAFTADYPCPRAKAGSRCTHPSPTAPARTGWRSFFSPPAATRQHRCGSKQTA